MHVDVQTGRSGRSEEISVWVDSYLASSVVCYCVGCWCVVYLSIVGLSVNGMSFRVPVFQMSFRVPTYLLSVQVRVGGIANSASKTARQDCWVWFQCVCVACLWFQCVIGMQVSYVTLFFFTMSSLVESNWVVWQAGRSWRRQGHNWGPRNVSSSSTRCWRSHC